MAKSAIYMRIERQLILDMIKGANERGMAKGVERGEH